MLWRKAVFIVLIVFCLSPLGSPAAALILGVAAALTIGNPFPQLNGRPVRLIFQISVISLGLDTDLWTLYQTVKGGVLFVIASVLVMIVATYLAGRFDVKAKVVQTPFASDAVANQGEATTTSYLLLLTVVFLAVFPFVGHWLRLTPMQFGVWSALAVPFAEPAIGASLAVNADAVNAGTALVLLRVLLLWLAGWAYSRFDGDRQGKTFPWFILVFVLVVAFRTYAPPFIFPSVFDAFVNLGGAGVLLTLLLLGAGLSRSALTKVQAKPIVMISLVWIALSAFGLWAVLRLV